MAMRIPAWYPNLRWTEKPGILNSMLRVLILASLVYLGYRAYQQFWVPGAGQAGSDFKCATCRHCARLDEDGVMCRFGNRQTFKHPLHIANCIDYEQV